jgi:hypothetical protein
MVSNATKQGWIWPLIICQIDQSKKCRQSFLLQLKYASLIKLNYCIQLQNDICNVLMRACIKNWKFPSHKQNPNVIPNLIQYVYVIALWNAPKLKLLMIWSWHKNSNKFSNIESYLHFQLWFEYMHSWKCTISMCI